MRNNYVSEKGWFNEAGEHFKWKGDPRGVGIWQEYLEGGGDLVLTVEGQHYWINRAKARKLVEKYKSKWWVNPNVWVVPKDSLNVIEKKVETEEEHYKKLSLSL